MSFNRANQEHAQAVFERVAWPVIGPLLGLGELIPTEVLTGEVEAKLDMEWGIDALSWCAYRRRLFKLACRVQWPDDGRSYKSWTLRDKSDRTEFRRLVWGDTPRPDIYIQAYCHPDTDGLIDVAAIESDVLRPLLGRAFRQVNKEDGTPFMCVNWAWADEKVVAGQCLSLV